MGFGEEKEGLREAKVRGGVWVKGRVARAAMAMLLGRLRSVARFAKGKRGKGTKKVAGGDQLPAGSLAVESCFECCVLFFFFFFFFLVCHVWNEWYAYACCVSALPLSRVHNVNDVIFNPKH